jgi:hypothetical protein
MPKPASVNGLLPLKKRLIVSGGNFVHVQRVKHGVRK